MTERKTKRSIKSDETKRNIIEAGRRILRRYGYENTTVRDICQVAGVSTGSFYHFFESKHDVLRIILAETDSFSSGIQMEQLPDSIDLLIQMEVRASGELFRSLTPAIVYDAIFSTPGGNRLMLSNDRAEFKFLLAGLRHLQEIGKITKDVDAEQILDDLKIAKYGIYYTICTSKHYDQLEEESIRLYKMVMAAYMI